MKTMRCCLLAVTLCSLLGLQTAAASRLDAGKPSRPKHVLVPAFTVMEWFSVRFPRAGQRETVYVRAWQKTKPLRGARLDVTVKQGKSVLVAIRGGTTDRSGQASVRFQVPKSAKSHSLQVVALLHAGRTTVMGTNTITVR